MRKITISFIILGIICLSMSGLVAGYTTEYSTSGHPEVLSYNYFAVEITWAKDCQGEDLEYKVYLEPGVEAYILNEIQYAIFLLNTSKVPQQFVESILYDYVVPVEGSLVITKDFLVFVILNQCSHEIEVEYKIWTFITVEQGNPFLLILVFIGIILLISIILIIKLKKKLIKNN